MSIPEEESRELFPHPDFATGRLLSEAEKLQLNEDIELTAALMFGEYQHPSFVNCYISVTSDNDEEVELTADFEEYEEPVITLEITSDTGEVVGDRLGSEILETKEFTLFSNGFFKS